jgi:hypothetical protein
LSDGLRSRFGEKSVFMDLDTLAPGVDFVERIQEAVGSCDVVLVLIGHDWLNMRNPDGVRRIDDPEDFVRLEVAAALERQATVVPVLVEGAQMPTSQELPDDIRRLARHNAIELSDARWHYDVNRLVDAVVRACDGTTSQPAVAREEAPERPSALARLPRWAKLGVPALVGVLVVVAVVVALSGGGGDKPVPPPARPVMACGGGLSVGPHTTCAFARNVKAAYAQAGGGNVTVTASSPATGQTYSMTCASGTPHVCTGGDNASVFFP